MGSMNRKQTLLCALAFIIPALVGFFVWSDDGKRSGEDSVVAEITESGNANEESRVLVYVVGAVKEPGVYELQRGSRVYDAVQAAGNVLPYADMESVNMAEPVEDAMRVYIPLNPERTTPAGTPLRCSISHHSHSSWSNFERCPASEPRRQIKLLNTETNMAGSAQKRN